MRFSFRGAVFAVLAWTATLSAQPTQVVLQPTLSGDELSTWVRQNYYPTNSMSYTTARQQLYGFVDLRNDSVRCVYTGSRFFYNGSVSSSIDAANANTFNAEHTWPQSYFNENLPMRSDLHHLFPTWNNVNSARGNFPFEEIPDSETATWWGPNKTSTTSDPALSIRDQYSESASGRFEPREDHKGNVARAMFYFWTIYRTNSAMVNDPQGNEAFFNGMKNTLYQWHLADPVDAVELQRSNRVASVQGRDNPFVLDSTLARRIYFYNGTPPPPDTGDGGGTTDPDPDPDPEPEPEEPPVADPNADLSGIIISQYYEGASNNKWIEITNVGNTAYDFTARPVYVCLYANPQGAPGTPTYCNALTGVIGSGASLLLKNGSAVLPSYAQGTVSTSTNFNGNDPLILSTASGDAAWAARTDVFGTFSNTNFAADVSVYRNTGVNVANPTYTASEWTQLPYADVDNAAAGTTQRLGHHVFQARPTSTEDRGQGTVDSMTLISAYPNPFNPTTEIGFQMAVFGQVRLSVFDLLGREVAVLVDGRLPAGPHNVTFDAAGLPSGVYLIRLATSAGISVRSVTLLK